MVQQMARNSNAPQDGSTVSMQLNQNQSLHTWSHTAGPWNSFSDRLDNLLTGKKMALSSNDPRDGATVQTYLAPVDFIRRVDIFSFGFHWGGK